MSNYTVISSILFREEYEKLAEFEKERIDRFLCQLAEKGDLVGKPLSGRHFFREKKYNGNRMYFLVYKEWKAILVAAIGQKKVQDEIIAKITRELPYYHEFVRNALKEQGLI